MLTTLLNQTKAATITNMKIAIPWTLFKDNSLGQTKSIKKKTTEQSFIISDQRALHAKLTKITLGY